MQLKSYEVWISCDGKPLPEHCIQPEGRDGKTLACFIPSECGKSFVIEWRDRAKQSHLRLVTTIDGTEVGGNRCIPGERGIRDGVRTSPTTRKSFKFANLLTTDDDAALGMSSHEKLGEIEVAVSRIRAECRPVHRTWGKQFRPTEAVHERSKKAGVHCVTLGEDHRTTTSRILTQSTPLDPREGNVATFIFRYRPLALLQAQGVVPIPTSVDVKPALRATQRTVKRQRHQVFDDEDVKPDISAIVVDDDSDLEGLKSQLLERLHTVERTIKRGRTSNDPLDTSHVKAEPKAQSPRRTSQPVVIDLTLSDTD